jgi:hypothetical protein
VPHIQFCEPRSMSLRLTLAASLNTKLILPYLQAVSFALREYKITNVYKHIHREILRPKKDEISKEFSTLKTNEREE